MQLHGLCQALSGWKALNIPQYLWQVTADIDLNGMESGIGFKMRKVQLFLHITGITPANAAAARVCEMCKETLQCVKFLYTLRGRKFVRDAGNRNYDLSTEQLK